jgi:hypothetical protein
MSDHHILLAYTRRVLPAGTTSLNVCGVQASL